MKKLTASHSLVTINHFKNEILGGIAGEMPLNEVWPELWVINDIDFDRAQQLIGEGVTEESPSEPWRCRKCGEENEGQFAVCWNCETPQ